MKKESIKIYRMAYFPIAGFSCGVYQKHSPSFPVNFFVVAHFEIAGDEFGFAGAGEEEVGGGFGGFAQNFYVFLVAQFIDAELLQVVVHELRIQKREAAAPEAGAEMDQCHLTRVRLDGEHTFAEERRADGEAVEAADEFVALPAFDTVDVALPVHPYTRLPDLAVDPGFGPVGHLAGAAVDDLFKRRVDADRVKDGAHRLAFNDFLEAAGDFQVGDGELAAQFGADPVDVFAVGALGHREETLFVGFEQEFGGEDQLHGPIMTNLQEFVKNPQILMVSGLLRGGFFLELLFEPVDGVFTLEEFGLFENPLMERQRRLDARNHGFADGALQPADTFLPRAAMDDELADHGVVIGRDGVAAVYCAVEPYAQTAGGVEGVDTARRGGEIVRVFGVDADFDAVAAEADVLFLDREGQAGGDPDLLGDEVNAGEHFGHGVFDLNARIHLHEIKLAVFVEKLDGACADIAEAAHRVGGQRADFLALFGRQDRRWPLLHQFLVAALDGAIAFAQVNGVAVLVAENLDFDVARGFEEFFDVDGVVAEIRGGLGPCGFEGLLEIVRMADDLHSLAAAAAGSFNEDREAHALGDFQAFCCAVHAAVRAGDDGKAEFLHGLLGADLVAHFFDNLR